ncbi:HNH endonuclease family protein [Rubrivivax gelatinosus IL144]|uniref:HNH endonuclease family protein n=2 Tax=Rubrivivax gelatinosus TaxID=28068 RepID=I0HQK5_RUBGI|nr:HNH endonuclease family protein [Rubrivivax gelatinosus IL144]
MLRKPVALATKVAALTEAGYRCAVPTCRTILALDIHHLVHVSEGGGNEQSNLLPLCPTCHALFHRGEIHRDSLYAWKSMLVALSQAFDQRDIDDLLFVGADRPADLLLSGDGVARFSRLIGAGLANYSLAIADYQNGRLLYRVHLTERGTLLLQAWKLGDRNALAAALGAASQETPPK